MIMSSYGVAVTLAGYGAHLYTMWSVCVHVEHRQVRTFWCECIISDSHDVSYKRYRLKCLLRTQWYWHTQLVRSARQACFLFFFFMVHTTVILKKYCCRECYPNVPAGRIFNFTFVLATYSICMFSMKLRGHSLTKPKTYATTTMVIGTHFAGVLRHKRWARIVLRTHNSYT